VRINVHGLVRADRADLVRLLAELTPEEWAAPTALPGWSVHDVAAHAIAYDELGWGGFVRRFGQAPLGLDRANDIGVHADRGLSREQVLERYPRHPGPRGLSTAFGGRLGLTEAWSTNRTSAGRSGAHASSPPTACGWSSRSPCGRWCCRGAG